MAEEDTELTTDVAQPLLGSKRAARNPDSDETRFKVYQFINGKTTAGYWAEEILTWMIWAMLIGYIVATEPSCASIMDEMDTFAVVASFIFLVEYLVRLYASAEDPAFGYSRFSFFFSFFSLVDLVTTLPFLMVYFITGERHMSLAFIRVLKLLNRFSTGKASAQAGAAVRHILHNKAWVIMSLGYFLFAVWMMLACCYYITERNNPAVGGRFDSIMLSAWYSLVFLMGEFPVNGELSDWGKVIAVVNMIFAIGGVHGMATGIIVDGYTDFAQKQAGVEKAKEALKAALASGDTEEIEKAKEDLQEAIEDANKSDDDDDDEEEEELDEEDLKDISLSPMEAEFNASGVAEKEKNGELDWLDSLFIFIEAHSGPGRIFEMVILALVFVNVTFSTLDTVPEIHENSTWQDWNQVVQPVTMAIFTLEYILRFVAMGAHKSYQGWRRLIWAATNPYSITDLLAVVPYWVQHALEQTGNHTSHSTSVARVLRVFRIFRVFTFRKYVEGSNMLWEVLVAQAGLIQSIMYGVAILLVFFSILMWYTERDGANEAVRVQFDTVPKALWLTLLNFTGEYPVGDYTNAGKCVSFFVSIIAIAVFGIAPAILSDGIGAELEKLEAYHAMQEDKDVATRKAEKAAEEEAEELERRKIAVELEKTGIGQFSLFMEGQSLVEGDKTPDYDPWYETSGLYFQYFLMALISFNTVCVIIESVDSIGDVSPWKEMFQYIETVCVIIFSVEIILRCIAAHGNPAFRGSWCEPAYFLGYIFSFQGVFDIISVVPWYVDQFTSADDIKQLVLFRALRLFRLLRIERYLGAVSIFYQVFTSRSISLICAGFLLVVWTLVFATLLHETEKDNMQIQGITKMTMAERFRSVPSALFYTFIHLTGDYPLYKYTYWGRLVNVFMIMLGQILIGLPIGIIIDGFQEAIAEKAQRDAEEEDEEEDKKDEEEDKKKDGEEEASKEPSFQESLFALVEGYGLSGIYFNIIQALVIMLAFGNLLVQSDKAWYGAEMFPDDPQFTVGDFFEIVGYVAATFFVVEYVIRIYCCPVDPKFEGGSKFTAETWKDWNQNDTTRRLCYMTDFMGVIDLIAWVSFFTAQAFDAQSDARVIIGSFQVLMLIKFDRVCPVFTIIDDAIGSKDTRSYLVCTLILALIVWILFASLFFVFEQDEADQHGSFANMPLSLFYTMILMGGEWCRCDLQIPFGEITGVFLAIFGIGIVGIPPSIFADTFSDVNEQATAALKAKQDPDTENCCSETCDDMVCWKRARPGDEGAKSSSGKGSGTGSGRSLRGDVERGNPGANYGTASPNPSSDWVAEGLAYQG